MAVGAVAGTKFYIGTLETTPSPDDWLEIGNIANLGDVVLQFSKIAVESVGSGYTRQIKGTLATTPMTVVLNRDDTDAGQLALKAAFSNRNALYWFRLVENDIVLSATTTVFQGRAYNSGTKYGGVNTLKQVSVDIEIEPDTVVTTQGT